MASKKKTSSSSNTVKYNPNTGAKLKKGESVVSKETGKTVTQGTQFSGGGSSSSSSKSSSSSSQQINNYNPNTGAQLKPGETVINAATGQKVTQGTVFNSSSSSGGSTSNIINYNPNTGATLKPGETVLDNATGKYITQGTPLGTVSSTPPKPTGINAVTSILNLGSQGDQVKELQSYLVGQNYKNADGTPLKVDGVFGANTQTALKQYQQANGLTPDGVAGPLTIAKMRTNANTNTEAITPIDATIPITGDPTNDALLKELQTVIKQQQDAGLQLNPDLVFDQSILDKFLETAKKQVHPFYQQQIDTIKQDVLKAAPQILENYGSEIANKEANFTNDLSNSRESNAGAGLAFSGGRAKGELGALDAQNRDLASLSQTYGNKLYDLGRTAESKIGASATPSLGSLRNYSANLGGNGSFNSTGSTTPYTPGGYQIGSLTQEEEAAIEARNQALKKTASEAVVAGRGYSDLFS